VSRDPKMKMVCFTCGSPIAGSLGVDAHITANPKHQIGLERI